MYIYTAWDIVVGMASKRSGSTEEGDHDIGSARQQRPREADDVRATISAAQSRASGQPWRQRVSSS